MQVNDDPASKKRNRQDILYNLDVDMVLNRMRAGRLVQRAHTILLPLLANTNDSTADQIGSAESPSNEPGFEGLNMRELGGIILEELVLNGRLSLNDVRKKAILAYDKNYGLGLSRAGSDIAEIEKKILLAVDRVFSCLVESRLVYRAPTLHILDKIAMFKIKATRGPKKIAMKKKGAIFAYMYIYLFAHLKSVPLVVYSILDGWFERREEPFYHIL